MTHHSRKVMYMDVGYYIQVIITHNHQSRDFFRNQNFKYLNRFNHFVHCSVATAFSLQFLTLEQVKHKNKPKAHITCNRSYDLYKVERATPKSNNCMFTKHCAGREVCAWSGKNSLQSCRVQFFYILQNNHLYQWKY